MRMAWASLPQHRGGGRGPCSLGSTCTPHRRVHTRAHGHAAAHSPGRVTATRARRQWPWRSAVCGAGGPARSASVARAEEAPWARRGSGDDRGAPRPWAQAQPSSWRGGPPRRHPPASRQPSTPSTCPRHTWLCGGRGRSLHRVPLDEPGAGPARAGAFRLRRVEESPVRLSRPSASAGLLLQPGRQCRGRLGAGGRPGGRDAGGTPERAGCLLGGGEAAAPASA